MLLHAIYYVDVRALFVIYADKICAKQISESIL